MPFMRYKQAATHLRTVREACAHRLSDHAHRQALQLPQNIAPEVHTIRQSVIAPRDHRFAHGL